MKYINNILIVLLFSLSFSQEEWNMTVIVNDIQGVGTSDQIILGMCQNCSDEFKFGEDEYDLPPPPGYHTDVSFFNFDWLGTSDENGNVCDNPEFHIDKKSFHEPVDLLIWEIGGLTNLIDNLNNDDNLQISWSMEDLDIDYEVFLYIGNSSYNMRNISNAIITEEQLLVDYNSVTGEFSPNIRIVIGGCAESGDISEYYYDEDEDGLGFGDASEFCTGKAPYGWVLNNEDINDQIYCLSNIIDECDDCDGNSLCVGCSDVEACNYSSLVTIDDGSCYYIEEYYNCDGDCLVDSDGDDVCDELESLGCTDLNACNYDLQATDDDGSCEYPVEYYDCDGNCLIDSDEDNICDELEVLGCTNLLSCLFDPDATEHNGSCCLEDDDSCIESPGQISNLNINVELNSAIIDWEQPCGISGIWVYRLLEGLDDSGEVIPSPFTIGDLDFGTNYTYYLKTINTAGFSITEINFDTEDEPLPGNIEGLAYESEESAILLNWLPSSNSSSYNILKDGQIIDNVDAETTSYVDNNVYYNPSISYEYMIQGVNSQGNLGNLSLAVYAQALPIPSVINLGSEPDPGLIDFYWEFPEPYASVSNYSFELYNNNNIVESNYTDLAYTISDLSFGEEVCFGVKAVHQFGESDVELICSYPDMPYPPSISDFTATGYDGYVSITWSLLEEPNHFINIYRDEELIVSNINTIDNPPPYINDQDDGYGMLANQSYNYQISALNANFIEGEISNPIIATTLPLPIISDLSSQPGDGRVLLNWSALDDYAGSGYIYEVIDEYDNIILETTNSYATVSSLTGGEEYCFHVRANSIGGYGVSNNSNEVCATPQVAFDGTEGDNDIDWGIQLSLNLSLPGGDLLLDTQNMLGVASDATDDCDSTYDIIELTDTPNDWAKLHFPHQDWDCALVPGSKYNNDIRSEYLDPSEVKEWDVQLETNSWSDGIATVSFHFYEQAGGNAAYYTVDNINYTKINEGDQIEYGLINPVLPGLFKVIVGNIVPESPINIEPVPGYREVQLSWIDGYVVGSLNYESSSYNIYRNGSLIANTSELFFIDRGLDPSMQYDYQISGLNIAGEGDKSDIISAVTLFNRAPVPDAGVDLIIYDFDNDGVESGLFSLPLNINSENFNESVLLLTNISFDPDNYFDFGIYDPPLDQLNYLWESPDNFSNQEIYEVQSNGYGLKTFTLEVNDGALDSDYKDSVDVNIKPLPAPAKVYVDTLYSGLYSIDIEWLESNYTGEPYIKSDISSNSLIFEDGDYFEDVNDNGVYDSGADPLPPFYGLSNLNNAIGFKNIADYYEVEVNGILLENIDQPCITNPEDISLNQYCYSIQDLDPSTEYSIVVKSCNFNDECNESESLIVSTGDMPYVEILYPNGAEIIGFDEPMSIELDFGSGVRYVDSLYLSILIDGLALWDTTIFTSTSQNIIDNSYMVPISYLDYSSTLNPGAEIEARIADEGGVSSFVNSNYYDNSDNAFVITSNSINKNFNEGWHLIGTPVILDSSINMQSHINSGIDFNYNIYWQIVDESEQVTDPISPTNQIFNSGEGYYLNLYSGSPIEQDFTQNINLSGDVVSEYIIEDLHVGWNLISNPLVISMNINNLNIIDNDNIMNWEEANLSGLIAPYLLEFDRTVNTLIPSYQIEPYQGYWLYLYKEVDIQFKSKIQDEDDLDGSLSETDFLINLYSNSFGQSQSVFGDYIQLGYSLGASNDFINGIDVPSLDYQYFNQYTSMHIQNNQIDENNPYAQLSRDIREHYQPIYVWDIEGVSQAIYDQDINPDSEIELFWNISDIDSNYVVFLEYGQDFENQTNMRELEYVKLNDSQFSNMRVVVELQNYFSGCSETSACNYFCSEKPWECPDGSLPNNFVDDNSCDLLSCLGCMDALASNYNPNATVDSVCSGGPSDGVSCMGSADICGDEGVCLEEVCDYNESYLFQSDSQIIYVEDDLPNKIPVYLTNYNEIPIYGVEIELSFDPEIIDLSSVLPPDLSASNSIIEGYSSLSYIDSDQGLFYFIAYPINNNIAFDGGLLFDLEIEVVGGIGDSTSIMFNRSILNDTEIANSDLNLFIEEGSVEFSGDIGYYSNINSNSIESVDLNLIGYSEYNNPYVLEVIDTLSAFSLNEGGYIFDAAFKGNYIMQASKSELAGADQGLSAVDASRVARYLINLVDFNEDQMLAADVDMNGNISAVDASRIARYLIGLTPQLNDYSQHWRFRSGDNFYLNIIDSLNFDLNLYDLRPLNTNLDNQDIVGIRIGDVDGSWVSNVQARKGVVVNETDLLVSSNELLSIPIGFSNQEGVEGIDLKIFYDDQKFFFDNFELKNNFENYNMIINDSNPGELSLVIYAGYDVEVLGNVFGQISLGIIDSEMSESRIIIDKILVNGEDVQSGFQIFDDARQQYIYSRLLNVSAVSHPVTFKLDQCYPNPFNPVTQIPFSIPLESDVNIMVYDISGRFIETILASQLNPGKHIVEFDGQGLSSGVYIVKMHAKSVSNNENFVQSNKVLLLK